MRHNGRSEIMRLARYVVSGGTAAAVEMVVFKALVEAGQPPVASAIASLCVAVPTNFLFSSLYVFKQPVQFARFLLFIAGSSIGISLDFAITIFCVSAVQLSAVAAKTIAISCAFTVNYLTNSRLVFRPRDVMDT